MRSVVLTVLALLLAGCGTPSEPTAAATRNAPPPAPDLLTAFPALAKRPYDTSRTALRVAAKLEKAGSPVKGVRRVGLPGDGEAYVAFDDAYVHLRVGNSRGNFLEGFIAARDAGNPAKPLVATLADGETFQVTALLPKAVTRATVVAGDGRRTPAPIVANLASARAKDPMRLDLAGPGGAHSIELTRR